MAYSIGEVAKMLRVSTQSLRSWEKERLTPTIDRTPTNRRVYTNEDIMAIQRFLEDKKQVTTTATKEELEKLGIE